MSVISIPTFGEILAVSASRGQNSEAPHLWRDAVGLWPMQEGGGGTVFDVSGRGENGTLAGVPDWTVTANGHALDFDGTNDYVALDNPGDILDGRHISVSGWIYGDTWSNSYPRVLDRIYNGQFAFYIVASDNEMTWALCTASGNVDYVRNGTASISTGVWNHCVWSYDGITMRMYINGTLRDASSVGIGGGLDASSAAICIGDRSAHDRKFDGRITNLGLWCRGLVASEIQQLHAEPWAMYTPRAKIFGAATAPSGDVSGTSNGVFSVTGAITGAGAITGGSDGVFSVTGNIAASGVLTGGSDGVFSVTGNITGAGAVAGGSDGAFSVTGGISGVSGLAGGSDGVFSVTGAITGSGSLGGGSDGVFTVTGVIVGAGSVAGSSDGVFSVTGAIGDGEVDPITGSVVCAFSVTGAIIGSSGEKYSLYLSGQVAGDIYISGGSAGDIYSSGLAAGAVKSR